jgi:DNA-directed RNA polymerase specialized sigma24 family protein
VTARCVGGREPERSGRHRRGVSLEPTLTGRETVEARFGDFYRAEYPAAVRLAATLTLSSGAEDVVQEAFARVFKRFDDLDRPAAYLRVTVVSVVHETHRRRGRERSRLEQLGPHVHHEMPQETHMVDVLARLPFRQRSVLVLR